MSEEIPQWAKKRACDEVNEVRGTPGFWKPTDINQDSPGIYAFARYIAQHEEPPVDPLLVEAREIAAQQPGLNALQQKAFRDGNWDKASTVPVALAALRRGIEIAKERDNV